MRKYLSRIFLLAFMFFVGISLCVTDYAQATIEESKVIEWASPHGYYRTAAALPEPGTIY